MLTVQQKHGAVEEVLCACRLHVQKCAVMQPRGGELS